MAERPKIPKSLRDFYCPNIKAEDVAAKIEEIYSIPITEAERDFIEQSTKSQSSSLMWKELRAGRITASVAHSVLHARDNKLPKSTILNICKVSSKLTLPSLDWGKQHEQTAIKCYQSKIAKDHVNLNIKASGLRLHAEFHVLGASADAIATCNCHGKFLVEVKCPYKHKEADSLINCIEDPSFCLNEKLMLKENHKYMAQVQMQMNVYKVYLCHFVIWTPKFCHGIEIPYSNKFESSIQKMYDLHRQFIAPEIITRCIENAKVEDGEEGEKEDVNVYCYCQQPSSDQMIGCDNSLCKRKWFHFKCAKIKRPPKGNWFCKNCKNRDSHK